MGSGRRLRFGSLIRDKSEFAPRRAGLVANHRPSSARKDGEVGSASAAPPLFIFRKSERTIVRSDSTWDDHGPKPCQVRRRRNRKRSGIESGSSASALTAGQY